MNLPRTRFAPAPNGTMHLGNIRAALMNLIFAKKNNGVFILRIEDTDALKSSETLLEKLLNDLKWLGIEFDEGPGKIADFGPYKQSQRADIYKKALQSFIEKKLVYKCFCTKERLEELRHDQAKNKQAPRYDRHCFNLEEIVIEKLDNQNTPFVWRFFINQTEKLELHDLNRGKIIFDMAHFGDFVVCRSDETFNFLFANFVDDVEMKISHIIRGEDHLGNGALQLAMYKACNLKAPLFLHLPMIQDVSGQKLSKSSKNFDFDYLRNEGYLAEAICNYLFSLGTNLTGKISSIEEAIEQMNPSSISTQPVKYDLEEMKKINAQWIKNLSNQELAKRMKNLFGKEIIDSSLNLIELFKNHSHTLRELLEKVSRFENEISLSDEHQAFVLEFKNNNSALIVDLIGAEKIDQPTIKELIAKHKNTPKDVFVFLRTLLTNEKTGLGVNEMLQLFSAEKIREKINKI